MSKTSIGGTQFDANGSSAMQTGNNAPGAECRYR